MDEEPRSYVRSTRRASRATSLVALALTPFALLLASRLGQAGPQPWWLALLLPLLGLGALAKWLTTPIDGLRLGPDGITECLATGREVHHPWATVRDVEVSLRETRLLFSHEELLLARWFSEKAQIEIAQDVRERLRLRGAPDHLDHVDRDRLNDWLGTRSGQWVQCGKWPNAIAGSDAGLLIRRLFGKRFVGWADLAELELLPAEDRGENGRTERGWRVTVGGESFVFRANWPNAERLAQAIEYALSERAVGHRLPAAADLDVPAGAISVVEPGEDGAERGISRA
ncbi:MAG: hypothetical protein HYU66_00325 [Armatimonadetes bacterium]|nr:hypothetical protein [Armatimonadota bacterium]